MTSVLGSLYYIKQLHQGPKSPKNPQGTLSSRAFTSQQKVLDALLVLREKENVSDVFVEGCCENSKHKYVDLATKKAFRDYRPGDKLTDQQAKLLRKVSLNGGAGGAAIYSCLFPDVTIRAMISAKSHKKVHRLLASKNVNKAINDNKEFVLNELEGEANKFMTAFSQENPGKNMAVIMGRVHRLSKYLEYYKSKGLRFHDYYGNNTRLFRRFNEVGSAGAPGSDFELEPCEEPASGNASGTPEMPAVGDLLETPIEPDAIGGNSQKWPDFCDTDQAAIWRGVGKGRGGSGYIPSRVQTIPGSVTFVDQNTVDQNGDGVEKFRDSGKKITVLDIEDIEAIKAVLDVVKVRNAGKEMDFARVSGKPEFLKNVAIAAGQLGMNVTNIPDEYKQDYEKGLSTKNQVAMDSSASVPRAQDRGIAPASSSQPLKRKRVDEAEPPPPSSKQIVRLLKRAGIELPNVSPLVELR